MITGSLQRKWSKEKPSLYNKSERIVRFDVLPESRKEQEKEEAGFSFFEVQIDGIIEYGHIKSQLIEAAFAQKDEFGLLMNAVRVIVDGMRNSENHDERKLKMSNTDIDEFVEFCEYRDLCSSIAKEIVSLYQ